MQRSHLLLASLFSATTVPAAIRGRVLANFKEGDEVKTAVIVDGNPIGGAMQLIDQGITPAFVVDPILGNLVTIDAELDTDDPMAIMAAGSLFDTDVENEVTYAGHGDKPMTTRVLLVTKVGDRIVLTRPAVSAIAAIRKDGTTMMLTRQGLYNYAVNPIAEVNSFDELGIDGNPVNLFGAKLENTFGVNVYVEDKGWKPFAFNTDGTPAKFGDKYLDGLKADEYLPVPVVKCKDGRYILEVVPALQGIDADTTTEEVTWIPFMAIDEVLTADGEFDFTLIMGGADKGNVTGEARTFEPTTESPTDAPVDELEAQADDGTDAVDADEDTLDHADGADQDKVTDPAPE